VPGVAVGICLLQPGFHPLRLRCSSGGGVVFVALMDTFDFDNARDIARN